jgi:hypothetical protein
MVAVVEVDGAPVRANTNVAPDIAVEVSIDDIVVTQKLSLLK